MASTTPLELDALRDELCSMPGVYVPDEGPWVPTIEKGTWRVSLFLNITDGGAGSLGLVLTALREAKVRCGAVYYDNGDWPVRLILTGSETTPDVAAQLIADEREEMAALL